MIRVLAALLLVFHFSFTMIACTSGSTGEEDAEFGGPIEEDDGGELADDGSDEDSVEDEVASDDTATNENQSQAQNEGEGGLEDEFDNIEDGKQGQDELVAEDEDQLEEDLAQEDKTAETPTQKPEDELAEAGDEIEEPAEETPAPPVAKPEAPERAKIRDIRYMANSAGGTVVIESSKPVTYQTRMNTATQQFIIEIADAELPASLQRPYQLKDFKSRIGSINAYQSEGSNTARVVIQMDGPGSGEPIVQQEGTSLVVVPPAAPAPPVAQTPAAKPSVDAGETKEVALAARTLDEFLTGNQKFFGRLISLQVKDADVRDVVNFLAEESGANIVMSDDVTGKISLKLRRVPWDQALVTVMRTKSLGYVRQGNVLRISTLKSLQAETEAANKILEAQKSIAPQVVQVIPISYANLDDLKKSVDAFLSKDGKSVIDTRTNTVIITDKSETVDRIQRLIKTLDVAPAQVSIESKIVEAVEAFERVVGVNWSMVGSQVNLSPGGGAQGAPIDMSMSINSQTLTREFAGAQAWNSAINVGTLDFFGDLTAALTLAERDQLARVISSPRISSMNREKSTIRQEGENVSIIQTRVEQTGVITKQERRTPFKLELSVTPQITADGGVIMDLDVTREFLGPVVDAEIQASPVNRRFAKTKLLVRNGQTAVIGGIYTSDELESQFGTPGLKDVPVLGWLFKNKSTLRAKNELLIFMTPRILSDADLSSTTNAPVVR